MSYSHWRLVKLGDYASIQGGYAYKTKDFCPVGIPVLKIKNVQFRNIDTSEINFVHSEIAKKTQNYFVKPNDILISMTGSGIHAPDSMVGRVARYTGKNNQFLINQRVGRFVINHLEKLDTRYLFFVLTQSEYQWELVSIATGSANQVNISAKQIESLEIPLPPLPEQKAIASILSSLDDKIELNQQMNQTLEAIARAIFKSWFVDFDPVRAKMAGNQPVGMDAATANLFPDSFEESALGLIPRGWTVKSADNICNVAIGKTPPRKESYWFSTNDNNIRWVSIRDMGENGLFISDTKEYLVPEAIERFNIKVIPDNTVLFSFKLTIGRVVITDGEMTTNEAIAHFNIKSQEQVSSEYLYSYLKNFDYNQLGNTSSIAQAVNSKIIKTMPILIPDSDLINHFTKQVNSIFIKIKTNQRESRTLANIRDTLLPKLMSGEIRVKEAETIIKEVN